MFKSIIQTAIEYFNDKYNFFTVISIKDIKQWENDNENGLVHFSFVLGFTTLDGITFYQDVFGGIVGDYYFINAYNDYDGSVENIF